MANTFVSFKVLFMATRKWLTLLALVVCMHLAAQPGQLTVPRIAQMPDLPSPYLMRDWQRVALKYDSFVYDVTKTGQYLPLTFIQPKGINYPENASFRMHTYVGTNSPLGNEAINVLPSLVGATLSGIDKTKQFGKNWIIMSRDFYNRANGEDIYLNNAGASSGQDWWYDVMPNVFFYQLYDLYGGIDGEAQRQFVRIADRFSEAVVAMGGSQTPWSKPYMNYRAWKFASMQPNATGVPEPEAAGAFAWLLYNAYTTTGDKKYLRAAEWCMEFLHTWSANPSYELQLPYGVLAAARMNAELGTAYDIPKMVNWCFDRGTLRGWGAITGNWGGLQVSGLIGEANDNGNDYAFQMNGFQQAACLVPMVRYDKRFAAAIGKWVLNLANASRLFYPGFLPSSKQDASDWSAVHDPGQVVGYEALRQVWQGVSPYSTGDAKKGGWAATNLALYGTSSVGYLASLIRKTSDERILELDVRKSDFYQDRAYPTYLYYNPYDTERKVTLSAGMQSADIYEMLREDFIAKGVTSQFDITIPARQAIVVVHCPAGGQVTYESGTMRVNGIVIDYRHSRVPYPKAPRIKGFATATNPVQAGRVVTLYCTADDADSPSLTYTYGATAGTITGTGSQVTFAAPLQEGIVTLICTVTDETGNYDRDTLYVSVVPRLNGAPSVTSITANETYTFPGGRIQLLCNASDPDGDALTYVWKAQAGTVTGTGAQAEWLAPSTEGVYRIEVEVRDSLGAMGTATSTWLVYTFDPQPVKAVAHYPFKGNALDQSGNNLHGTPRGVVVTADRNGRGIEAYYFNGGAQSVLVPNHPLLNTEAAMSVSVWVKPQGLPDRETFIVSHGSWQNRWKLSVTPDKYLRWTVNTSTGIADLDAPVRLVLDEYYHVTAIFDGSLMALYVNGTLQGFRTISGTLRKTTFPLLIGQMLPDITTYNFKGTIDEVTLFGEALVPDQVEALYLNGLSTSRQETIQDGTYPLKWTMDASRLTLSKKEGIGGQWKIRIGTVDGKCLATGATDDEGTWACDITGWPTGIFILTAVHNERILSVPIIRM